MAHEFYIDKTFYEYYTLVRFIGSGAFGRVVFALDNQTGFECAVKILEKKNFKPKKLNDLR